MVQVFSYGAVELENHEGTRFKVNDQRIKHYMENTDEVKMIEGWVLDEV